MSTALLQVLMIVMFFLVVLAAFGCYFWYYREYGKLARYFLVNMFRFPSSYGLMILLYGVRPFLKGTIHALMFYHWSTQVWMLFATELTILLIMLVWEFTCDNHRSKPVFMMDVSYSTCLMMLNILFLCKYKYFKGSKEIENLLEEVINVLVYFMLMTLLVKLVWESFPWSFLCKPFQDEKEETEEKSTEIREEEREKTNGREHNRQNQQL